MLREEGAAGVEETGRKMWAFRLLVVAQDLDMGVAESREMVREMFGLTDAEVSQVEQEGIRRGWPPL
jgi:hypothetical protein